LVLSQFYPWIKLGKCILITASPQNIQSSQGLKLSATEDCPLGNSDLFLIQEQKI